MSKTKRQRLRRRAGEPLTGDQEKGAELLARIVDYCAGRGWRAAEVVHREGAKDAKKAGQR